MLKKICQTETRDEQYARILEHESYLLNSDLFFSPFPQSSYLYLSALTCAVFYNQVLSFLFFSNLYINDTVIIPNNIQRQVINYLYVKEYCFF